jgi:hypothetical protein
LFTPQTIIMEDQYVIYIGAGGLSLVLYYVITRWAHEIQKRNRYMEAQIKLLSKIAEKQGVETGDIEVINRTAETVYQPLA